MTSNQHGPYVRGYLCSADVIVLGYVR